MKKLDKKKKIILIVVTTIIVIGIIVGGYFLIGKKKNSIDNLIAASITMDINPSIRLDLNKNMQVIEVVSLNADAKDLVDSNYKGKKLKEVVSGITDKLIDKGYAKEELTILLGVSGNIKSEEVKEIISNRLEEKEITYDIIIPLINENSADIAKEYNITESKAAYLEEVINKYTDLKIEDIKDLSIKDINNKIHELEKANEKQEEEVKPSSEENTNNTSTSGGTGGFNKCDYVTRVLTNEEAGIKAAGFKGATVSTGSYCDILPPESYIMITSDGTCAYKVSFKYRTERCTYYIGIETGNVLDSSCSSELVSEGEAQCIIMNNEGITARENLHIGAPTDNGSEYVYRFEDVYGTPDEDGQRYIYEYRVSKYTGAITKKEKIDILR